MSLMDDLRKLKKKRKEMFYRDCDDSFAGWKPHVYQQKDFDEIDIRIARIKAKIKKSNKE